MPLLAITALDVAFAAAITAPFSALLVAWMTQRHDRRLAHDARVFEARRDVYQQAAIDAHRAGVITRQVVEQLRAAAAGEDPESVEMPVFPSHEETIVATGALVTFASPPLEQANDRLNERLRTFLEGYEPIEPDSISAATLAAMEVLSDEVWAARNELAEIARSELTALPPTALGRRMRRTTRGADRPSA